MDWPDGYGRRMLDEVDSTNAEAARLAAALAGPEWICATRQTRARGRRARAWASPEGSFAATLVLRPEGGPERAALRSFVAALALDDALAEVTGTPEVFALKWPNDVLLNGGKVAGILLEGLPGPEGALAVGVGVNLVAAPPAAGLDADALRPVSLLGETGIRIGQEAFLGHLAASYARREAQFATLGFAPIRRAWLARAARRGESLRARTGRDEIEGVFETVDDAGHLVLKTPTGRVRIAAADIFF